MNVRMMLELLVPCVQHAEKSDLGTELPGVAGDFKQRLGAGPEQQGIHLALILQRKRRKLPRQCEDHMDIACEQQFFLSRCEPAVACISLTFWAMPVSARVV